VIKIAKYDIIETEVYSKWFASLNDNKIKARIGARINRVRLGNLGDTKSVGDKVFELKCQFGAGYRIYFTKQGKTIIILLCGGDKSTQEKDVKKAKQMVIEVINELKT